MRRLIKLAKRMGVSVRTADLEEYDGFYAPALDRVYLSTSLTEDERAATLAHELGHVFHGHDASDPEAEEMQADVFAIDLLELMGREDLAAMLMDPERDTQYDVVTHAPVTGPVERLPPWMDRARRQTR